MSAASSAYSAKLILPYPAKLVVAIMSVEQLSRRLHLDFVCLVDVAECVRHVLSERDKSSIQRGIVEPSRCCMSCRWCKHVIIHVPRILHVLLLQHHGQFPIAALPIDFLLPQLFPICSTSSASASRVVSSTKSSPSSSSSGSSRVPSSFTCQCVRILTSTRQHQHPPPLTTHLYYTCQAHHLSAHSSAGGLEPLDERILTWYRSSLQLETRLERSTTDSTRD